MHTGLAPGIREATKTIPIFDNQVMLYGFGVNHSSPTQSWTLKNIEESARKKTHAHVIHALRSIPNTNEFLSPSPDEFNSVVIKDSAMKAEGVSLQLPDNRKLYRGIHADGIGPLGKQQAFIMSSADCALLVVQLGDKLFAVHAGRDSLLDRSAIESNGAVRKKFYGSVVDAIFSYIPKNLHHKARAHIGFTITQGEHFAHPINHPVYGESNKKMLEWITKEYNNDGFCDSEMFQVRGHINLKWLIRKQLEKYGVHRFSHDTICTYSDRNEDGEPVWFSQRRTPGMRNLIVVANNQ